LTEPPDEKFGDLYDHILAKMIPGKALSLFYKEAVEEIQTSGMDFIPEYGLGQGIGLSLKDPPLISDSENRRFDNGMCFTLRLTSRDEKNGALMKGNTILLSENDPVVLTR
jgi:nucleosome binding factor SPN SPT16 subunit